MDVKPGVEPPTYRHAYGTHFDVASTWMLLLGVYVVVVVGGLILLWVIPVRFANEKTEPPFVLWFGSTKKKKKKVVEKHEVEMESCCWRGLSWMMQMTSRLFAATPTQDIDTRYRFQADMTQQLAASAETTKDYQSIAMETTSPTPLAATKVEPRTDASVTRATEVHLPLTRPSSRSSIFTTAPPSTTPTGRMRRGTSRIGSEASTVKAEPIGRRSRVNSGDSVVETKEDFIRAASRRQSMAIRAERRVNLAREDVSYENLDDDEMQVYEYLEFVRELLDGLALKKICQKSGRVVSRKLYITTDMQVVFWNSIGAIKRQTQKSSIRTELIESVQKGLHGSARVTAVSSPEREARCVSISCSDGKCLALEAKTEALRQRLYFGFSRLAQEHNQQQDIGARALVGTTIPEEEAEDEAGDITSTERRERGISTEVSSQREEKRAPLTRGLESRLVFEQHDYEEKAPPPSPLLEEELLRHELLSIRASYEEPDDQGAQEDQPIERLQHALDKFKEDEEMKQDQPFQDQEEDDEHKEEYRGGETVAAEDVDIDNLSDDPELSRE